MRIPCVFPWLLGAVLAAVCRFSVFGAVVVNAPQPITHRVEVQPVVVSKTTGATVPGLGDAAQSAYIKEQINRIWAQAGVRIDWLPSAGYTNNFACDGSPDFTSGTRPTSHLNTIVQNAPSPPKSADARTINLFFVQVCPGFPVLSANSASGLAFVDGNGITAYVGLNLLGFEAGRDVIAGVIAHEIGHNLGLNHESAGDNLMSPGSTEERLTAAQKTTIFTDRAGPDGFELLRPAASNYSVWAQANGLSLGASGDDDGDGLTNVVEFMLDLPPRAFSSLPQPVASSGASTWTLPKRPEALADGLIYRIRTSSNLQTWVNAGTAGSGSTVQQDNSTTLTVRLHLDQVRSFMKFDPVIPPGL